MDNVRIITLMFHRVNEPHLAYHPKQFADYLSYLAEHFPIVVPGDPLPLTPFAICLTFDDAYYDFYHDVFPLLQKYQIKALLAVPVKYIVSKTTVPPSVRLSVPYPQGMGNDEEKVPFCTWEELKEMADSQHVIIASHGYAHTDLSNKACNLKEEIELSKQILEEKLNIPIQHFIYPYGKMTRAVHKQVCATYAYGFRIGSALNIGWGKRRRLIYRINADPLWTQGKPLSKSYIHQLTLKYWLNQLRSF